LFAYGLREHLHDSPAIKVAHRVQTSGHGGWDDEFQIPDALAGEQHCLEVRRSRPRSAGKIVDLDLTIGKRRNDFQLAAHRTDIVAQRADVHVGAPLHLGDGGLVDIQCLGQTLLAQLLSFAQLMQRHFLQMLLDQLLRFSTRLRRHASLKFSELLRHGYGPLYAMLPNARHTAFQPQGRAPHTTGAEFIRVLNVPTHENIPPREYKLKSLKLEDEVAWLPLAGVGKLFVHPSATTPVRSVPCKNVAPSHAYAAKTQLSKCKRRSNTRLLIGFEDPGVPNAP
jgi:hypothetical protein